jgi:hypothetical protein
LVQSAIESLPELVSHLPNDVAVVGQIENFEKQRAVQRVSQGRAASALASARNF